MIEALVPPPLMIGAVQTLISVLSDAVTCLISVYVLPAASLTPLAVALPPLQTPTSTTNRLPAVMFVVGVTARLVTLELWPDTCWTNAGTTVAGG